MGFVSFIAKFSAVFAAGYGLLFAATNIVSGFFTNIALSVAGWTLIGLDVFALMVWIVNAVWYNE